MLWFARASVGLAGFLGKILVALKKLFSSTIFPDYRCIYAYRYLVYVYYIYLGIHARSLNCFKKNFNLCIIALNLPHVCSVLCNLKN